MDKQAAVRKKQKIQDSNRAMFLWVAGASVVVGFAAVACWFLWQQTDFKLKVIAEKESTANILRANNKAIGTLRDDIRVLQTNSALAAAQTADDENAVQVVLDALPADANSLALGASLQKKLLAGIAGLEVDSLTVDPVDGTIDTSNQISFTLTVSSGDANDLQELLSRFEHSIRVIDIDNMKVDRSSEGYTLSLTAHAYYEPAKNIELTDKKVTQ